MLGSRPPDTPLDPNCDQANHSSPLYHDKKYRRLVGKLIYLIVTRADISTIVGLVSHYLNKTKQYHQMLYATFSDTLRNQQTRVFFTRNRVIILFNDFLILIMLVSRYIEHLPLDIVCLREVILSHGGMRNKMLLLDLVSGLSTVPRHTLLVNCMGEISSLGI